MIQGRFLADGSFYKLGVRCVGVLLMRALLFGVYIGPFFVETPLPLSLRRAFHGMGNLQSLGNLKEIWGRPVSPRSKIKLEYDHALIPKQKKANQPTSP